MLRTSGMAMALLVAAAATAACSGDDDSPAAASRGDADTVAFCDEWNSALAGGGDAALVEALAGPPSELEEQARLVREAETTGDGSPAAEAAAGEIVDWTELNCPRGGPGTSTRRVATPIDAVPDGLTFCATFLSGSFSTDGRSGMLLYGPADAADPYDGPMLGLFWNPSDQGTHVGDGSTRPVTVRGQAGVAAPITVFQQAVVPELGTVIAWSEGERAFGLYGRLWPIDRAGELVEIADAVEVAGGGFRIPAAALPDGYEEVFAGDPSVTSLVVAPSPLYSLRYQGDDGLLDLHGLQMTEAEFEAFRFLTLGVDQGDVAGHDGLVGSAWHADGPAVVTWREPDGLVVRIMGIGVPLEVALDLAAGSRELAADEWAALVQAEDTCEERVPEE